MSEFSQFKSTPSSSPIDVKDAVARQQLQSTQSVTGNPITLTDAAPINAERLVVELEPKQDLHGYQYPWVGGAGKNKLDCTLTSQSIAGMTITVDSEKRVTINGKCTSQDYAYLPIGDVNFKANVTYRLTGCPSGTNCIIYSSAMPDGFGNAIVDDGNGGEKTTTSDFSDIHLYIRVPENEQLNNVVFSPMFRIKSDGDDTFAPYKNECPITGYTQTSVDGCGKNLFDENQMVDTQIGGWGYAELQLEPNTTYIMSSPDCNSYLADNTEPRLYFYIQAGTADTPNLVTKSNYVTQTTGADGIARVQWITSSAEKAISNYHFMLNIGVVSLAYEPYASTSATIQFGQTVYGGEVDFKTGVFTGYYIKETKTSVSGSKPNYYCTATQSADTTKQLDIICDKMKTASSVNADGVYINSNGALMLKTSLYDDATSLLNAFGGEFDLCFPLAKPFTIQLTPQELKLLKGTNNITTNGTTITLGYQPDNVIGDVKGEIEKITVMPYLRILDNDIDTEVKNYRLYYRLISSSYTLVNLAEMLQHRFLFVEIIQNPSGTANHTLLHSALIDPRTIDGFEYQMKAGTGDTVIIESNIAENKFDLSVRYTGTHTSGDPTDYYVTIRMVD